MRWLMFVSASLRGPYLKQKAILERIERLRDPEQRKLAMTTAQHLRQEGIQQGMQQGMQRGMQQGRQEGRQEGMHTRGLEIARNMLSNMHLDMQTVARATGLSQAELTKLQETGKARS